MNSPYTRFTEFGKKETLLSYACQTYQRSHANNIDAAMVLIRECQPKNIEEWERWYWDYTVTGKKISIKVTEKHLHELGERLYDKIRTIVIPEWTAAFQQLSLQDCIDYIHHVTMNCTLEEYICTKSVIHDGLATIFPEIQFEESDPELDHAGDVDYIGWVGTRAFGIQIKPVTAQANFGNYSPSERMQHSFTDFEERFGGKVFIVLSLRGEIHNADVIENIRTEIARLRLQQP